MKKPEFLISKGVDIEKSLELFGTIDTYNDTVGELIMGLEKKIKKLQGCIMAQDINNYEIYVHSLKSDAKIFGFNKLAELALLHEQQCKEGNTYYIYENFENLAKEVSTTISIVKEYLSDSEYIEPEEFKQEAPEMEKPVATAHKNMILVVDDSNIIRNFVKRIFENDYEIGTAKDGQEAIEMMGNYQISKNIVAVLLDLNMPRVDGFEVLKFMEKNDLFKEMPVSIISGDSTKETINKAFEYPIVDMLSKPFNDSDVKRVIDKTLMYKDLI